MLPPLVVVTARSPVAPPMRLSRSSASQKILPRQVSPGEDAPERFQKSGTPEMETRITGIHRDAEVARQLGYRPVLDLVLEENFAKERGDGLDGGPDDVDHLGRLV